ncbi:hypothetical protein MTR_6g022740 [Medicago truncatula]|uniref:Uncharacterized protein n=1 Tax=Medicago truncatula TaxID=3880 RepID=A0A072U6Q9_MEDTR|nr:hypothetical protein MTR_6g022740 [Medicago truncatula]
MNIVGLGDSVTVLHFQFVDDTLLLGEKSWVNVRALRVVLVLFEALSSLKVNFHKSMLVGVNINGSWLTEAAAILRCKMVDRDGLWYRVLVARYGEEDGRLEDEAGVVLYGGRRERFSRLYGLALHQSITVKDMFLQGWGEGGEAWQWRRRLWVWEEDLLEESRLLLHNVSLQSLSYDVWQWLPDPSEGSPKGVSLCLAVAP